MTKESRRRCLACRERSLKDALVRVCWTGSAFEVDEKGSKGGRGAYVHRVRECWKRLTDSAPWERAFRLTKGVIGRERALAFRAEVLERKGFSNE